MKKVIIAMSGGVDSSVALLKLKEKYDIAGGVTLHLHECGGDKSCGSKSDSNDARSVAENFGVKHYVYDYCDLFREKVIGNFVKSYEEGKTPNPCIDCNRYIKFGKLLEATLTLGCDYVATGHYARVSYDSVSGRWLLKKAVSENGENNKDQSYVLYNLTQEQLAHVLFPLGEMSKDEVRALAAENGLINADKPDSQDICFVSDGSYADFIEKQTGNKSPDGDVVNVNGETVGRHCGLINYTIGQRKGLGIAFGVPTYVVGKDMENNRLIVGGEQDLLCCSLTACDLNWIAIEQLDAPLKCKAKTRYKQTEQACEIFPCGDGNVRVVFEKPQRAVTPGQRVVFYDGDVVIGGGVIM